MLEWSYLFMWSCCNPSKYDFLNWGKVLKLLELAVFSRSKLSNWLRLLLQKRGTFITLDRWFYCLPFCDRRDMKNREVKLSMLHFIFIIYDSRWNKGQHWQLQGGAGYFGKQKSREKHSKKGNHSKTSGSHPPELEYCQLRILSLFTAPLKYLFPYRFNLVFCYFPVKNVH